MQCRGTRVNVMSYFEEGHRRTQQCQRTATHAIGFGLKGAATINGWRPLCGLCANEYVGYKAVPIEKTGILELETQK
jgi:hypothetical protein